MSLSERAMLVDLTIGCWEGRKKDKDLSARVPSQAKAREGSGSWWTQTVSKEDLRDVRVAVSRGRETHAKLTLPWNDEGMRILPAEMYLEYTKTMRELRTEYEAVVAAFLDRWPSIIEGARERLGDLFKANLFPTAGRLAGRFHWTISFLPMPDKSDFRIDLGDSATATVQTNIEQQVEARTQAALRNLWERLFAVVEKVSERLGDPENIFRDSMLSNVVELCDMLPKLNITGDARLDKMRRQVLKRLTKHSPGVLRQDTKARSDTAAAAKKMLKTMSTYLPAAQEKEGT